MFKWLWKQPLFQVIVVGLLFIVGCYLFWINFLELAAYMRSGGV